MKRILLTGLTLLMLSSCEPAGVTSQRTNGNENSLPEELKGLKVYQVSIGNGDYVQVGLLDGKINSTTYRVGKHTETTIIIGCDDQKRVINAKEIISETDSILVIRK
jgi:hypothetical protein